MKNSAILNAWRLVIDRGVYMPKSLRGKVKLIVTDNGVELIKIKKNGK